MKVATAVLCLLLCGKGWLIKSLAVHNIGIFTASTRGEYTRRFDVLWRGKAPGSPGHSSAGKATHRSTWQSHCLSHSHLLLCWSHPHNPFPGKRRDWI